SDQQLYKFKEGDFVNLHLNDIEDMLLFAVQHKLFHLDGSDIINFIVALQIEFKEPYTPSYDRPGIVYEDLNKQKRVLLADELYKFSDDTLKSVHDEIHHRVLDFCLDYKEMTKRKWTVVDRKRSGLIIELIDKQLRERSKSENKGIVPTEMELVLEQTQQGTSHEVSISTEGVEELKRKVKIKGEKKEALLTLRQKLDQYINYQKH
ncbi:hypothetical protein Tco_0695542, partial [Tanacetum coccineum]